MQAPAMEVNLQPDAFGLCKTNLQASEPAVGVQRSLKETSAAKVVRGRGRLRRVPFPLWNWVGAGRQNGEA